jgi:diguanylate cyclase (GGDEF)-like protein/PAS domain S-box-containing protein
MRNTPMIAFNITAIYIITSVLWILLSDYFVNYLISDTSMIAAIEVIKGCFFVAITAGLLYRLISQNAMLFVESKAMLQKQNEETMSTYEELLAAEEELKQQFDELLDREGKISRRNECLYALHEASVALMQGFIADDFFAIVVRKMLKMSGAQYGYIYLLDDNAESMMAKTIEGFSMSQIKPSVNKGEGIIGKVWESGKTIIITNYHDWEDRLQGDIYSLLRTGIGIPLKVDGKVIGVFSMNYTVEHAFDKEELQMLDSFAELISISLGNFLLHEALQVSQHRNQVLIDALPDSIYQFYQDGTLLAYNKGKELESIIDMEEKIGQRMEMFWSKEHSQIVMEKIKEALLTGITQFFEYKNSESSSIIQYQEIRIVASGAKEAIAIVRDITNRKEMECKLQYYAWHDRVTGLHNRVYFEESLQRLNESSQVPIGIVICDIDGLKLVNDTFGHQAGDELLAKAAAIIDECFAGIGEVARIGGDEFAVILPNHESVEIEEICHRIRQKVHQFCEKNTIPMSISIGSSIKICPEQSLSEVFKAADDNMYREKLHSNQSVRSSIVQTLGKALEARDFVTDGHADRLQSLVVRLGVAMGLQDSKLPDLRLFGRFHDIGKVGIPDHILFKPGRLSDDEFIIMKRHCEIGYRIAQSSGDLAPIADWILKHQEWWNGQGYPLGIKADEIPLACRILSIVDAYDAMTNDRPYRKAMPHDSAIAEIERCAGTQFDPNLIEVFKRIVIPES